MLVLGSRDGGAASQDREERARQTRERQNSERARKLEELRAQALSAQRFREQKEEERRRRIDEMRSRDNDRRHQVNQPTNPQYGFSLSFCFFQLSPLYICRSTRVTIVKRYTQIL